MRHRGRVIATISILGIAAVAAVPLLGADETGSQVAAAPAAPSSSPRHARLPPMHRVDDADWVEGEHVAAFDEDPQACAACHGATLEGSVRSRASKRRLFRLPGADRDSVALERGERVSCGACHDKPDLPDAPTRTK